MNFSRVGRIER
jgi:hypothetical protein